MGDMPVCSPQDDSVKKEWIPTRNECLQNFEIRIKFLSMGCIVEVGCKSIPFQFVNDAMDAINQYVENPHDERKKWEKLIESRI